MIIKKKKMTFIYILYYINVYMFNFINWYINFQLITYNEYNLMLNFVLEFRSIIIIIGNTHI